MAKKNNILLYTAVAGAAYLIYLKSKNTDKNLTGINGYYDNQLDQIDADDPYGVKIKISQGGSNYSTNYLNLNSESVETLIKWLRKNKKKFK